VKRRSGLRSVIGFAIVFGGSALLATPARGQTLAPANDGRFVLEIQECPRTLADGVRRLVAIEVGDLLRQRADDVAPGGDTLAIRCAGNFAQIEASGGAETAPAEKLFQLDDFPGDAAPRALALASLELMAARNSTVRERMDGNPSSSPLPPTPTPAKPPAPTRTRTSLPSQPTAAPSTTVRVGLAAVWRTFPATHGPTLWGGQVQASAVFNRLWRGAADAELSTGQNSVSLGQTRATLLTAGANFGVQHRRNNFEAGVGLGGRVGAVRLSGTSADPAYVSATSVWRPWGGPMTSAHVSASLGQFALTAVAEAGLPLLKPEGQAGASVAIALDDPWAAIALGASIRL